MIPSVTDATATASASVSPASTLVFRNQCEQVAHHHRLSRYLFPSHEVMSLLQAVHTKVTAASSTFAVERPKWTTLTGGGAASAGGKQGAVGAVPGGYSAASSGLGSPVLGSRLFHSSVWKFKGGSSRDVCGELAGVES